MFPQQDLCYKKYTITNLLQKKKQVFSQHNPCRKKYSITIMLQKNLQTFLQHALCYKKSLQHNLCCKRPVSHFLQLDLAASTPTDLLKRSAGRHVAAPL